MHGSTVGAAQRQLLSEPGSGITLAVRGRDDAGLSAVVARSGFRDHEGMA